jgi:transcriptional regulator with XRE-family HTH domain
MGNMNGQQIRDARKHLGLTQKQLAEVMGYAFMNYISKVESGSRDMSEQGCKLLQAYLDGYRPKDWPVEK